MTEYVRLGDVAKLINGRAYSQSELLDSGKYPVLRVGNFFSNSNWYYSDLELNPEKYCDNGDLLYAWSASFGAKIWSGGKVIFHYHIWKIILSEKINREYLYHYLNYQSKRLKDGGHGSSMIHLTKSDMENHIFPLPPLEEQKHIASALDTMSSVIAKRKQQIALLDEAAKSLFVEMFGDPVENPMGWEVENLEKVIVSANNGMTRRGNNADGNIVLRLVELQEGFIDYKSPNRINLTESEKKKCLLNKDDVLFARVNGNPAYVGRCAVFKPINEPVYHNDHIIRIHFDETMINSRYVSMYMNGDAGKLQLKDKVKTSAGQYTINQNDIRNSQIPLPPLDLQNLFAARIEALEAQRASCERGLRQMETAFAAMMQEYFG